MDIRWHRSSIHFPTLPLCSLWGMDRVKEPRQPDKSEGDTRNKSQLATLSGCWLCLGSSVSNGDSLLCLDDPRFVPSLLDFSFLHKSHQP